MGSIVNNLITSYGSVIPYKNYTFDCFSMCLNEWLKMSWKSWYSSGFIIQMILISNAISHFQSKFAYRSFCENYYHLL